MSLAPSPRLYVTRTQPRTPCSPLLLSIALLVGVLLPRQASAQPLGEVVVVPFGAGELGGALNVTSMLEAELAHERVALIPLHDARDRFTARSRPPQTASDSDLDVLAREAREAIEHVAFGRTAAAQKSVREVIARAEKTLESLNRETATARHILDACLSLVRTALQTGRRDLALEQATRCRRLVPDLVPSEENHPANVVGVLAEADNMLRRMRIGNLSVRSTPESNCSVYLNGRHLGTTPFQLDRAAAGDYRVQVECGRSVGRVHVVQLGDQAVSLWVDTQFDRTVSSDPRLLLKYESREHAREQAVSHAVQIGREVQADDVILVGVHGERAELLRVQVAQQRLIARASVPWTPKHGFTRPALEAAIVALAEGRFEGEPSLERESAPAPPAEVVAPKPAAPREPVAEAPTQNAEPAARSATRAAPAPATAQDGRVRQRRVRAAGWTLLGASVAMFTVGIAFDVRTQNLLDSLSNIELDEDGNQSYDDPVIAEAAANELARLQPDYEQASHLRWIGLGGSALGVAATAMLVRPEPQVPWWGYAFAGVGVGVAAWGIVDIARDNQCDLNSEDGGACRRPHDSAARGVLLLTAALPFLSVPLLQRLKPSAHGSVSLSSATTPNGMQLMLRGTY